VVREEVRVLEDAEDDQVHGHRERHPPLRRRGRALPRAIHGDRRPVVERDRRQHQPGERAAALRIEDDAEDEEQPVAVGAVLARTLDEVEREEEREEEEKKCRLGEQHYGRTVKTKICCRGSDSSTCDSVNPSASTSIFASASDILCSNLIGTV